MGEKNKSISNSETKKESPMSRSANKLIWQSPLRNFMNTSGSEGIPSSAHKCVTVNVRNINKS